MSACGGHSERESDSALVSIAGEPFTLRAEQIPATLEANGSARAFAEATLSTKLMGTITAVLVREGDAVGAGQVVARIDARDLAAKGLQVEAGIAEARAVQREAETHVNRMRALYKEDAASKAQLDAAETAYARASAGVSSAQAAGAELGAINEYSVIRAPFAGVIIRRFVDPGAFAAPGAPLLTIQDSRRLRLAVTASPETARRVTRGSQISARIEGMPALARVEGVVPGAGGVYTINAIADNKDGLLAAGGAASLLIPLGSKSAILVPARAITYRGDLTGVYVSATKGAELRWIKLGDRIDDRFEVLAGLRTGEQIIIPATVAEAR